VAYISVKRARPVSTNPKWALRQLAAATRREMLPVLVYEIASFATGFTIATFFYSGLFRFRSLRKRGSHFEVASLFTATRAGEFGDRSRCPPLENGEKQGIPASGSGVTIVIW